MADPCSFFEFFREKRGEVFCFQRFAKAFIVADSTKLKMRHPPPTPEAAVSVTLLRSA
jgi:hypothetical protein